MSERQTISPNTWTAPEAGWYRFPPWPPWPPVKVENPDDLLAEPKGSVTVVEFDTEQIRDGWKDE